MSVTAINNEVSAPGTIGSAKTNDNADKTDEGMGFLDFLDVINPLQHIPVISTIYRSVTGDELKNFPRIVGGALFGGPIGLVTSAISAIMKDETGKDPGEHVMAWLKDDPESPADEDNKLAELPNRATPVTTSALAAPDSSTAPSAGEAKIAAPAYSNQSNFSPTSQRLIDEGKFMPLNPAAFNPAAVAQVPEMPRMMPTSKVGAVRPGSGKGFMPVNPGQPRYFPVSAMDAQVQKAASAQGLAQNQHPMLTNRDPAFLSQSMMDAAEKYRRVGASGTKGGEF